MKKNLLALSIAVYLSACGGAKEPDWTGGLVRTWQPDNPAGVVILHQGHDCFDGCRYDDSLIPAAEAFAAAGYIVYGFEMPPEPHDHGPIERYYKPVTDLLDALDRRLPVYMVGLSGGGWTTTVVTALDARITAGYSVEGDPYYGDWEQRNTPQGYAALYQMAGPRLTHVAIPGSDGSCAALGHAPPCVNDYTTNQHRISEWAVGYMLQDMAARSAQPVFAQ